MDGCPLLSMFSLQIGLNFARFKPPRQFLRRTVLLLKPHRSLNLVYCSHRQAPYGWGFYYSQTDPIAAAADTLKCPGCGRAPKPLLSRNIHIWHERARGGSKCSDESWSKYRIVHPALTKWLMPGRRPF